MSPENYVLVHSGDDRRIFVIISEGFGDFVLTKECKGSECKCLGCMLLQAAVEDEKEKYPVIEIEKGEELQQGLMAYPFSAEGGLLLKGLKHHRYKRYKGVVTKQKLDDIFKEPDGFLMIKLEGDGTFTHSYMSMTVDRRVISKGCVAKNCPCLGCRIVDSYYQSAPDQIAPLVDTSKAKSTRDGELYLPVFEGDEILSRVLNRDPGLGYDFIGDLITSPLEQMFYNLAFLDLHLYPQHSVGKYRLDFALPDKKIAIELDGHEYHKTKYQRTHDAQRDRWLYGQGWHVLRFTGSEIYKDLDKCIDEICSLAGVERLNKV